MLHWRIYYDDGTTYDNEDGSPENAPKQGVISVVHKDKEVGRSITTQYDFYWWNYDISQWYGGDIFGLWDYLTQPGEKIVLFGRSVPRQCYRNIQQNAIDDPDFPEKSGRLPGENRTRGE